MTMDFTQAWHWPQWTVVIFLTLSFMLAGVRHGMERREEAGPRKGEVERHNAFATWFRIVFLVFVLTCGGFFA